MKTSGDFTPAPVLADQIQYQKNKEKKKKQAWRQDLRVLSVLDIARLPVDVSNQHGSETDSVLNAAETEVHSASLVGFVSPNNPGHGGNGRLTSSGA